MDGPSFSWYNTFDRMFNPIPNPDPTKHTPMLRKLLETLTSPEIGWDLHRIHLFGWGQGGSMALEIAKSIAAKPLNETSKRLGSVISICGPLLPSSSPSTLGQTPILLFTRLSPQAAAHRRQKEDIQALYKDGEVINGEKGKGGEDMPRGRGEWEGIMKFWGNMLAKDEGWKGEGEVYEVVR
jgi:pimeloyl-ACP methyl ester carboxylesterase